MKRLTVVVIVLIVVGILMSACGGGGAGGPVGAVQSWLDGLTKFDFKAVTDLTCSAQRQQIEQSLSFFSSSGQDLSALKNLFTFDFSKLKFEEKSNDGKAATVHLSGSMSVTAFGQSQNQDMNEDVSVVNENGGWKVCGNPLGQ